MMYNGYPALRQFLGGYFHQDFLLDYATPGDTIVAFKKNEPEEIVRAVCGELQQVLNALDANSETTNALLQDLGCYYDPSSDGWAVRDWFVHIQRELAKFAK